MAGDATPDGRPRTACPHCLRPLATCLCKWICATANPVELLILQHPQEEHQAKGTARLLCLSLARCRVLVGETFAADLLSHALGGTEGSTERRSLLLYPDATASQPEPLTEPAHEPERLRLVVLDATWGKSRKMIHLNPLLQSLPRLALRDPPPSRYKIRIAQQAHQRSTLEASVLALQQLEGDPQRYLPLLNAFDGWMASLVR